MTEVSIFVRQLEAITCEAKFDRHCNWIVSAIAWNAYSSFFLSFPPFFTPSWLLIATRPICVTSEQTKDGGLKKEAKSACLAETPPFATFPICMDLQYVFFCFCGRCLSIHLNPAKKHSAKFKALAGRIMAFVGRDMDLEISIGKKNLKL